MPKKKRKPGAGRPKGTGKAIDLEELGKLCAMQCTHNEIASWFNVSPDTIERRAASDPEFRQVMLSSRDRGLISLRRKQYELALSGDRTMLIWLGKQLLGQREKLGVQADNSEGAFTLEELLTSYRERTHKP